MNPKKHMIATNAFLNGDADQSKDVHLKYQSEPHKTNSFRNALLKYVEMGINGGINGLAVSCASASAMRTIFYSFDNFGLGSSFFKESALSFVLFYQSLILVATGLATGYYEYQIKSEYKALYDSERSREVWEYENYLEGEQKEMVELYISKGLSQSDAEKVIELLSKDKTFFVDVMMKDELEMPPLDANLSISLSGLVISISHMLFGLIPTFVVWTLNRYWSSQISSTQYFLATSLLLFFSLGVARSNYNVSRWWRSGFNVLLTGIGIFVGMFLAVNSLSSFLFAESLFFGIHS
eukprot:TRINITY_DN36_c1_g1_i2.p1 TRINITY_DN36_c1_g1~~TRINITY_DN36_c1_g1_i2.p1  ORF type:complete len:307 (+),score=96.90 TRINITY_DN36_c1_g1_i2:37-921(+)